MGLKAQRVVCGAEHVGPLAVGACPPGVAWGRRQCFATSIRPCVPLQTEPKEKSEGAVEGERSDPRPAGSPAGAPLALPSTPCPPFPLRREGWGHGHSGGDTVTGVGTRSQGSRHSPYPAPVPKLPMSPSQPAAREAPGACPSAGADPSWLAPLANK